MTILQRVSLPGRIDSTALHDWDELVQEDRVHRLIYTDPAIFAAEMTNVFGGTWVYLAHESEIPAENDYITRRLGLRPLIVVEQHLRPSGASGLGQLGIPPSLIDGPRPGPPGQPAVPPRCGQS